VRCGGGRRPLAQQRACNAARRDAASPRPARLWPTHPAGEIVHGKTSAVTHDGAGLFAGLPSPLRATRYHSLAAVESTLPACLRVTARAEAGGIQGVRHAALTVEGVQFHPESILTEHGKDMLANFMKVAGGAWPPGSTPDASLPKQQQPAQ
jgi:hypothetical protein